MSVQAVSSVPSPKGRTSPAGSKTPESTTGCRSPGGSSIGEDSCPICLGSFTDKCAAGSCFHHFCFVCLKEWAKQKSVCPLCKQPFTIILYDIKSEDDYKEWKVPLPKQPERNILRFFRLLFPSQTNQNRRSRTREQLQTEELPPFGRRERQHVNFDRGSSLFRFSVYTSNIWILPISNTAGRYRESCPQIYREQPALTHRLVPWLNRELAALLPISRIATVLVQIMNLIEEVPIMSHRFIRAIRPHFGSRSRHFAHEFYNFARSPYDLIGHDNAAEYVPHYDDNDVAPEPPSPDHHEVIQLDSDDDVIVGDSTEMPPRVEREIIIDNDNSQVLSSDPENSRDYTENPGRSISLNFNTDETDLTYVIRSTPVQTMSFNEPGPSGVNSNPTAPIRIEEHSSDSDDCFVVDVLKPKRERTPELIVVLSSDCEENNRRIKFEKHSSKKKKEPSKKKPRLDRNSFSLNYSSHNDQLTEDHNFSCENVPSTSSSHTIQLTLRSYFDKRCHSNKRRRIFSRIRMDDSSTEEENSSLRSSPCHRVVEEDLPPYPSSSRRDREVECTSISSSSSKFTTEIRNHTLCSPPSKSSKGDKSKIKTSSKYSNNRRRIRMDDSSTEEENSSLRSSPCHRVVEEDLPPYPSYSRHDREVDCTSISSSSSKFTTEIRNHSSCSHSSKSSKGDKSKIKTSSKYSLSSSRSHRRQSKEEKQKRKHHSSRALEREKNYYHSSERRHHQLPAEEYFRNHLHTPEELRYCVRNERRHKFRSSEDERRCHNRTDDKEKLRRCTAKRKSHFTSSYCEYSTEDSDYYAGNYPTVTNPSSCSSSSSSSDCYIPHNKEKDKKRKKKKHQRNYKDFEYSDKRKTSKKHSKKRSKRE